MGKHAMGFLRHRRDDAAHAQGRRPNRHDDGKAELAATPAGLAPAQRASIEASLSERGIGDALERHMFLAALDYQISSFAGRLAETAGGGAEVADQVCTTANGPEGCTGDEAQRLCRAFVAELARAYDACFETPPTADSDGPFSGVLGMLREATGLMLHCDRRLIDQAIGMAAPGSP